MSTYYDYDSFVKKTREPIIDGKYLSDLNPHELQKLVSDLYRSQDEIVIDLLVKVKEHQAILKTLRVWKERIDGLIVSETTSTMKDVIVEMTDHLASIRDDIVPTTPPVTSTDSLEVPK